MSFIEFLFWMPWWGWLLLIAVFYFVSNVFGGSYGGDIEC